MVGHLPIGIFYTHLRAYSLVQGILFMNVCILGQTQLHIDHYTSEEGLSENVVYTIHQDEQGFIWAGTDYGLNRYDGYSFRQYHSNDGDSTTLSDEAILCIHKAKDGGLWIGTYSGLNYFDPRTGKAERIQGNLPAFSVSDIVTLNDSVLLVRSQDLLAYLLDIPRRTFHSLNSIKPAKACGYRLSRLPGDRIGMFYEGVGKIASIAVYQKGGQSLEFYQASDLFPFMERGIVNYYYLDSQGNQYLCYQDQPRIMVYDSSGKQMAILDLADSGNTFPLYSYSIIEPDQQHIWIGTNKGLIIYDSYARTFTIPQIYSGRSGLKGSREIRALYSDHSRNIWMGIFGDGMMKWTQPQLPFRNLTLREISPHPASQMITGLQHWMDNVLAVETNDGNISIIRNGRVEEILGRKSLSVETMITRSLGINPANYSSFQKEFLHELDHSAEDKWLFRFMLPNDTTVIHYYFGFHINTPRLRKSYPCGLVKNVAEDSQYYWCATSNGLLRVDKKTFADTTYLHIPDDQGTISESNLYDVYADIHGTLWIGTKGGGLNYYNARENQFHSYTIADGLPDNVIYVILPDSEGQLWLTTNKGISKFNPAKGSFQNYSTRDGLLNAEFNTRGGVIMADGSVYLAGTRGIDYFDPKEIQTVTPDYDVVISDWRVNDQPLHHSGMVTLGFRQNNIYFSFTINDFVRPDKIYFRYRLTSEENWQRIFGRNYINFTSLQPGSYQFEVQASYDNLNWTPGATAAFRIRPPWWSTWWFVLLLIMIALSLFYAFYRARISQLKRLQEIRSKISRDLHDEIGSALSSIHLFSSVAMRSLGTNIARATDALEHINGSSRSVLEKMSDIVWAINTDAGDKSSLERKLKNYSYELLTPLGINCLYDIDPEAEKKLQHMESRKHILLIAKEALNNIAKYSAATETNVSLQVSSGMLVLQISDNGKGINPDNMGSGNGIINMQKRTEVMGGSFQLNHQVPSGTSIQCRIPIANISDRSDRYPA